MVDNGEDIEENNTADRFCAICGEILPTEYVASTLEVTAHNWMSKRMDMFVADVCYMCHTKIMDNIDGGIEMAYEKIGRKYVPEE